MIAYRIDISDLASPAVRNLGSGLEPAKINQIVGPAARDATQRHFQQLNRERPNQLGGRRTNYYLGAADKTSFAIDGDVVIISIAQIGIRLRYYGGTVTAGKGISSFSGKPTRFLTIAVHPKAHGKRASEFDLELVYNHNGEPVALATKPLQGPVPVRQKGKRKISRAIAGRSGEIYYVLKRSVTHKPDPSVLPAPDRIYGAVISNLSAYTQRLIARSGGGN